MTQASPLLLRPEPLSANGAESRAWQQQPPSSQLPPGHVSGTGTGKNQRPTWGVEGRGQGQVLTASAPRRVAPVTGPLVAHTPYPRLAAPRRSLAGGPEIPSARPPPGAATAQSSEAQPDQEQLEQLSCPRGVGYQRARPFARCAQGCASCRKAQAPGPRQGQRWA